MKKYQELIEGRIFIGGADDFEDVIKEEKIDVSFDLRAESDVTDSLYNRVHSPIVDDEERQDETVKAAIDQVVDAYNKGQNVYFHCQGGSNRTGTVAIGTLLALDKAHSIEEAEELAKAARPKINVKPEMKEVLERLYK
ncbi:protein tyrosine phosphatase [Bacillus coahuilensis m2-6]|uniref:Protein tyrosine phosphatase n=1 Tax=Bacillus coahuilensis p1.1.43 TaxID=1150625 RepID=A0A147KCP4_9BACI|nr:dual specificity protein phosphatase family protein [Bacillus coahuilensis]KUP04860.1 protein tyrosine phosphatase [Bacillus coahuilensis m2-6]KUP09476.1 protein tyrosine phosphatase [Bacillus coahuilensis p1.1.43]